MWLMKFVPHSLGGFRLGSTIKTFFSWFWIKQQQQEYLLTLFFKMCQIVGSSCAQLYLQLIGTVPPPWSRPQVQLKKNIPLWVWALWALQAASLTSFLLAVWLVLRGCAHKCNRINFCMFSHRCVNFFSSQHLGKSFWGKLSKTRA